MTTINHQIRLASRPAGMPSADNFRLVPAPLPVPAEGEVLCRTLWLSIDPYMRGRMTEAPSYAPGVELDAVMVGGTVGEVVESRSPGLAPGDFVVGYGGWQEYWAEPAAGLRRLDPAQAPLSTALGVLGMPGITAYAGLMRIGQPKPGETLAVAAAAGPVGSTVGQIAKILGLRAVGIAGGKAKCDYVVDTLGFDACLDHRAPGLAEALAAACPKGVDVYFENVGGAVLEAMIDRLNPFARVPVCGLISQYNAAGPSAGPDLLPRFMRAVLVKRLTVRGFIVWDFRDLEAEAVAALAGWLRDGRLKYREDVVDGLAAAPEALAGVLTGRNFGKMLVRVAADPTR